MPNDYEIYAGNSANFVRYLNTWDKIYQNFNPPHFDNVSCLSIFGDTLVSGSWDKNLWFWDMKTK
jgi:WD40 repeat protein